MKIALLITTLLCAIQTIAFADPEGRWVNQGYITTINQSEADFMIDFNCNYLSKSFYKHTFYFKQDWQFLTAEKWGIGHGMGMSSIGCGPNISTSANLSARARNEGVVINFSATRTFRSPETPPIEVKQLLEIPWKSFPYSFSDGDFSYDVTFAWNTK